IKIRPCDAFKATEIEENGNSIASPSRVGLGNKSENPFGLLAPCDAKKRMRVSLFFVSPAIPSISPSKLSRVALLPSIGFATYEEYDGEMNRITSSVNRLASTVANERSGTRLPE